MSNDICEGFVLIPAGEIISHLYNERLIGTNCDQH